MAAPETLLVKSKLNGSRMRLTVAKLEELVVEGEAADPKRGPVMSINGIPHPLVLESDQKCEGDTIPEAVAKRKAALAA